jgi:hypothetical protein
MDLLPFVHMSQVCLMAALEYFFFFQLSSGRHFSFVIGALGQS